MTGRVKSPMQSKMMLAFGPKCGCPLRHSPVLVGRQIGRMVSVIGTLSLSLNRAMSWSKFIKLKSPVMARNTNRLSGFFVSLQRSCSPNVTLIMNHMNLLVQITTLYIRQISPITGPKCPEGFRKLRFPDYVTMAQDGGKVASLTHRPFLPPGNTPGTHFC